MPALLSASLPRHDAAAQFRLALADQRQEELGQRAQIRLAQRADAARAGMKALAQHVANDDGEGGRETRSAAGDADQTHEQRCPNFVGGEAVADTDGARHEGLALEGGDLILGERRVDRGAQAGVQAIDRPIAGGKALDDPARAPKACRDRRRDADSGTRARHRHDVGDLDRPLADLDRPVGRQRTTPLALRKAAATARGSFLSTSTWRLSSCIVGLSMRAPTRSSASTALGLLATVSMRTTGARK